MPENPHQYIIRGKPYTVNGHDEKSTEDIVNFLNSVSPEFKSSPIKSEEVKPLKISDPPTFTDRAVEFGKGLIRPAAATGATALALTAGAPATAALGLGLGGSVLTDVAIRKLFQKPGQGQGFAESSGIVQPDSTLGQIATGVENTGMDLAGGKILQGLFKGASMASQGVKKQIGNLFGQAVKNADESLVPLSLGQALGNNTLGQTAQGIENLFATAPKEKLLQKQAAEFPKLLQRKLGISSATPFFSAESAALKEAQQTATPLFNPDKIALPQAQKILRDAIQTKNFLAQTPNAAKDLQSVYINGILEKSLQSDTKFLNGKQILDALDGSAQDEVRRTLFTAAKRADLDYTLKAFAETQLQNPSLRTGNSIYALKNAVFHLSAPLAVGVAASLGLGMGIGGSSAAATGFLISSATMAKMMVTNPNIVRKLGDLAKGAPLKQPSSVVFKEIAGALNGLTGAAVMKDGTKIQGTFKDGKFIPDPNLQSFPSIMHK